MSKKNTVDIALNKTSLNLNQEKDSITDTFSIYNKNNAPYYGGNLTPMWKHTLVDGAGDTTYTDKNEGTYYLKDGELYYKVKGAETGTKIENSWQELTAVEVKKDDKKYSWYYDENNYTYLDNNNVYHLIFNGTDVATYNNVYKVIQIIKGSDYHRFVIADGKCHHYKNDTDIYSYTCFFDKDYPYNYTTYNGYYIICAPSYSNRSKIDVLNSSTMVDNLMQVKPQSSTIYTAYSYTKSGNKYSPSNFDIDEVTFKSDDTKEIIQAYSDNLLITSNSKNSIWMPVIVDDKLYPYYNLLGIIRNTTCETHTHSGLNWMKIQQKHVNHYIVSVDGSTITEVQPNSSTPYITVNYSTKKLAEENWADSWSLDSGLSEPSYTIFPDLGIVYDTVDSSKYIKIGNWNGTEKITCETITYDYAWNNAKVLDSKTITLDKELITNITYSTNSNTETQISSPIGYAKNIGENWRLLINYGMLQAVSMYNNSNNLGTLLVPYSLKDILSVEVDGNNVLSVVTSDNVAHQFKTALWDDVASLQVVDNRYLVFNAVGYNLYDTTTKKWWRAGNDWNNRLVVSKGDNYITSAIGNTSITDQAAMSMFFNVDYLASYSSTIQTKYADDEWVQVYSTDAVNENAIYLRSYEGTTTQVETEYANKTSAGASTTSNYLSPTCLFTNYVSSYSNDVYAQTQVGYAPLYKNNNDNSPIRFSYYIGNTVTDVNIDALFVLAGTYYRLSSGIIYSSDYSGTLDTTKEITNIGYCTFVGAGPDTAYFWSYANRTLYAFTAGRSVETLFTADSITNILAANYSATTQTLFLSTNLGLILINEFGVYCLSEFSNITKIYDTINGFAMNVNKDVVSLYFNKQDDSELIPIKLETAYYGADSTHNSIADTLYVKIFNKDNLTNGKIIIGGYVQSNDGKTEELNEETIEITDSMFDPITRNAFFRYQPKHQRGLGTSWKVTSDYPISYLGQGFEATDEKALPQHNSDNVLYNV